MCEHNKYFWAVALFTEVAEVSFYKNGMYISVIDTNFISFLDHLVDVVKHKEEDDTVEQFLELYSYECDLRDPNVALRLLSWNLKKATVFSVESVMIEPSEEGLQSTLATILAIYKFVNL